VSWDSPEDGAERPLRPLADGLLARAEAAALRVRTDRADDQALHDFRVALRRLRVLLRAARLLYGAQPARLAARALRRFGVATGGLRDAEVLVETLAAAGIDSGRADLAAWLARRVAQREVLRDEAIALIAGPDLAAALDAVRQLVTAAPERVVSGAALGAEALAGARRAVDALLPVDREDAAALHRLRVRFKRLRYTSEIAARLGADDPARIALLLDGAKGMQDVLGRLHDADQTRDVLLNDGEMDAPLRAEALAALARLRRRLADQSMQQLATVERELLAPRSAVVGAGP